MTNYKPHSQELLEPRWPNIADLKYPDEIAKQLKAAEAAQDVWAKAESDYQVAVNAVEVAHIEHEQKIRDSARLGKPYPGDLDISDLVSRASYALEVVRARRADVENILANIDFRGHRVELMKLAVAKAEAGIDAFRKGIREVQEKLVQLDSDRLAAYDGLIMMAEYATPETYLSNPGIGAMDMPQLPRVIENDARMMIAAFQQICEPAPQVEPQADTSTDETPLTV